MTNTLQWFEHQEDCPNYNPLGTLHEDCACTVPGKKVTVGRGRIVWTVENVRAGGTLAK